jgi:hypothetical protein
MSKQASKSKGYTVDTTHVEEAASHFTSALDRLNAEADPRVDKLKKLFDSSLGTAFFMAPASARDEYHNCYAGGLAEHSMEVARWAIELNAIFGGKFTEDQLWILAMVHDLGKAGDGKEEYFAFKDSDWHQKQGIKYEINEKCSAMSISDRTLYLLQKNGIVLEPDEIIALKLVEARPEEVPDLYRYREPDLALILSWANRWSIQRAKTEN